ncbi:Oxygen tolerance [Caballeronia sp. SBC1]|uniref:BatD family protein n=1 Tax=Caballeronia sp. SBC1 TaxID=2705548 RepID=UPI00140B9D8D|nr:BatD family protein [Caballeronia sp. SBC1]QIN63362.1 Oxygen tolerance [Caballeronia sp. SBC1]
MKAFLRVLLILMFLTSGSAVAQGAPRLLVRAHIEPSGTVVAGTEVKLIVDCLTTTWFTEAPNWPLFTVPDAIVNLPDEQAENLHEVINGVSWYGVSRAYRVVPQTAGAFDIPSFQITVYPGGTNVPAKLTTPALRLVATVPAGAEGMSVFFPTQKLSATQTIEPSPDDLKVGGALTRTITQNATGTESMLIPPVNFGDVDGLKRYQKPSGTKNIMQDRAGLVAGQRTDTVTYVANRSGRFKLPPVTIEWWNTTTQRREKIVLPAVSFSATAASERPLFDIPIDALSKGGAHRIIVIDRSRALIFAAILAFVLALVWAYPRLITRYNLAKHALVTARNRYAEGEAPAWRVLRAAASKGPLLRIIPAVYRWMDKSPDFKHPARIDDLDFSADPGLKELADTIATHYADSPDAKLDWNKAEGALRRAAKRARKKRNAQSPLPPLNRY